MPGGATRSTGWKRRVPQNSGQLSPRARMITIGILSPSSASWWTLPEIMCSTPRLGRFLTASRSICFWRISYRRSRSPRRPRASCSLSERLPSDQLAAFESAWQFPQVRKHRRPRGPMARGPVETHANVKHGNERRQPIGLNFMSHAHTSFK